MGSFCCRMEMDKTEESSSVQKLLFTVTTRYQLFLDQVTPHPKRRWVAAGVVIALYLLRAATVGGFYIVSYALGIYLLNLLIGFLAPKIDPEVILGEIETDDEAEPTPKEEEEFCPFIPFGHPRILAYSFDLFYCPFHCHNAQADCSYDQVSLYSLQCWKAQVQQINPLDRFSE